MSDTSSGAAASPIPSAQSSRCSLRSQTRRLNHRITLLCPSGSIVALHHCRLHCSFSPASFTPPLSATGGAGVPEPALLVSLVSSASLHPSIWLNRRTAHCRSQPRRLNRRTAHCRSQPRRLNRRTAHCRSHCSFRSLPPPGLLPPLGAAGLWNPFRSLPPPGLLPPLGAAGLWNPFRQPRPPSLHPSIWLNRRIASLCPSGSIVALHHCRLHCSFSPASFTPPLSATGGVGVPEHALLVSPASSAPPIPATGGVGAAEPLAALRLRSPQGEGFWRVLKAKEAGGGIPKQLQSQYPKAI